MVVVVVVGGGAGAGGVGVVIFLSPCRARSRLSSSVINWKKPYWPQGKAMQKNPGAITKHKQQNQTPPQKANQDNTTQLHLGER